MDAERLQSRSNAEHWNEGVNGYETDDLALTAVQRRARIHTEAEAWRVIQATEGAKYSDEFVAVHAGQVIDHDADRLTLYHRVRGELGDVPVLITPGGTPSPREFQTYILTQRPRKLT